MSLGLNHIRISGTPFRNTGGGKSLIITEVKMPNSRFFTFICVAPNCLIIKKMTGILPRIRRGEGCTHLAVNQHLTRQALKKKPPRASKIPNNAPAKAPPPPEKARQPLAKNRNA